MSARDREREAEITRRLEGWRAERYADRIPDELLRDLGELPILTEDEVNAYRHKNVLPGSPLSEAELVVLRLLSHGLTKDMVAETLDKSPHTIVEQTKAIRYRLRAKNVTHAVALALRQGIID